MHCMLQDVSGSFALPDKGHGHRICHCYRPACGLQCWRPCCPVRLQAGRMGLANFRLLHRLTRSSTGHCSGTTLFVVTLVPQPRVSSRWSSRLPEPARLPPARSSAWPKVIMIPLILITRAPNASVGGGSCQHQTVAAPWAGYAQFAASPHRLHLRSPLLFPYADRFVSFQRVQRWGSHPCQHEQSGRRLSSVPVGSPAKHSGCGKIRSDISPLGFLASWHPPSGKASR